MLQGERVAARKLRPLRSASRSSRDDFNFAFAGSGKPQHGHEKHCLAARIEAKRGRNRANREEAEVLRGSFRVARVLQAAQLHLRLQKAVLLPRCADGGHVLPRTWQQVDLRVSLHQFRAAVTALCHARRDVGRKRGRKATEAAVGPGPRASKRP